MTHLLDLVEAELAAFRQSGRLIHLAHAERALAEAKKLVTISRPGTHAHVDDPLTAAASGWLRHHDARLGAALAYYSVFSLGPLLLIVVSVAGLFFGGDEVRNALTTQFRMRVSATTVDATMCATGCPISRFGSCQ